MGLDEVEVTQRSRDGGVDLKAIRKGVGDFSDIDTTNYYIQAKRYALSNKVAVSKVRELKGTMPFGYKGMMITTSDFTQDVIQEASNAPSKLVVMINGKLLVQSCIDREIGFVFKPIFSKVQMDEFLKKKQRTNNSENVSITELSSLIEKTITANDIRARIISIPSTIIKKFTETQTNIDIEVNEEKSIRLKLLEGEIILAVLLLF